MYCRHSLLLSMLLLCMTAGSVSAEMRFDVPQQDIGAFADGVRAVVAVDLDQDGDLDLVTGGGDSWLPAGMTHEMIAWENSGSPFLGGWTAHPIRSVDFWTCGIAAGDLDGDGQPDLVVSENNTAGATEGRVVVLKNDGTPFDGLWSSNVVATYVGLPRSYKVAMSDLDGDGQLDIAAVVDASGLWIWQNDGTPFSDPWSGLALQTWSTEWCRMSLSIGDLDRDGDPDLAFSPREYQLAVLGNDGTPFDGGWTYAEVGSPGYGCLGDIVVADFDGDLYPDLATTVGYLPTASQYLWHNDGTPFDGGWTQSFYGNSPVTSAAAGDLDLDGDLDLATGSYMQEDFEVIAWENDGSPFDGAWPQRDLCATGDWWVTDNLAADLDGDGDMDLAFVSSYNVPSYLGGLSIVRSLAADPRIASVQDVPNDQGRFVRMTWAAATSDNSTDKLIAKYTVWRRIDALSALTSSTRVAQPMGVLAYPPGSWDFVTEVPARGEASYSTVVPTLADSNSTGMHLSVFFVSAVTADPYVFYDSAPDSGYSVDNMPPVTPAPFTGAYAAGATNLHWGENTEADLWYYAVHRGSSADFVPGPTNLIANQADTGYVDVGPAGSFYKLAAVDINGNISGYALLTPAETVGAPTGVSFAFALEAVRPNPTTGEAMVVRFTLPTAMPARLDLIDVSGRRVVQRQFTAAGQHTVNLAERWRLPAGLYFVRLAQGSNSRSTRVVVVQ